MVSRITQDYSRIRARVRREMGVVAELISFSAFVSISLPPLTFFTLALIRDGWDQVLELNKTRFLLLISKKKLKANETLG